MKITNIRKVLLKIKEQKRKKENMNKVGQFYFQKHVNKVSVFHIKAQCTHPHPCICMCFKSTVSTPCMPEQYKSFVHEIPKDIVMHLQNEREFNPDTIKGPRDEDDDDHTKE